MRDTIAASVCVCVCTACLRASKCAIQTCARLNKNGYTLSARCAAICISMQLYFLPSLSSCICMHIVVVYCPPTSCVLTAECNLETSKYGIFIYVWEFALMYSQGVATWFCWHAHSSAHLFVLWEKGNVIACVYHIFIKHKSVRLDMPVKASSLSALKSRLPHTASKLQTR